MYARNTLRDALFAVALGILPLAAGCVSQSPLPSDVARRAVVWTGPPVPIRVGVAGIAGPRDDERGPLVAELARKSLIRILDASKAVASVSDLRRPRAPEILPVSGYPDVDVVLAGEIEDFELYSTYLWWALYVLLFAIPFAGTASVIVAVLLGGPVGSDHARLGLRLDAYESRTGLLLGSYRGGYDGMQVHTIYARTRVEESFISHPEIVFQQACGLAIQEMLRDRFWLVRFRRPAGAQAPPATPRRPRTP